jgi:hypothetical protein
MISVLTALAEDPELIKRNFKVKEVNSSGIYAINFYVNGTIKEIVIDDYLPCDPDAGIECFGKSR